MTLFLVFICNCDFYVTLLYPDCSLHKDYYHVAGLNRSAWTLGNGYPSDATVQTYPLRGPVSMVLALNIF